MNARQGCAVSAFIRNVKQDSREHALAGQIDMIVSASGQDCEQTGREQGGERYRHNPT